MANRRFTQFFYTTHAMPVLLDFNFAVGASGAVGTLKGPGIASVTRLNTGIYRVKFQDNYNKFFGMSYSFQAPTTGSAINDGSFVIGTAYQITAVGDTDWFAVGLPAGLTPTAGQSFVATAIGGAGTGTATAVGSAGIFSVQVVGNTDLMLAPKDASGNIGGSMTFKCVNAAGALTDPAQGSVFFVEAYLSNSSVQVQGE